MSHELLGARLLNHDWSDWPRYPGDPGEGPLLFPRARSAGSAHATKQASYFALVAGRRGGSCNGLVRLTCVWSCEGPIMVPHVYQGQRIIRNATIDVRSTAALDSMARGLLSSAFQELLTCQSTEPFQWQGATETREGLDLEGLSSMRSHRRYGSRETALPTTGKTGRSRGPEPHRQTCSLGAHVFPNADTPKHVGARHGEPVQTKHEAAWSYRCRGREEAGRGESAWIDRR